jgi:hypothetical protein
MYPELGRTTHDSINRQRGLADVTFTYMAQDTIPTGTNQLPSRNDMETWWLSNEQSINLRSEHGWDIDVQPASTQNVKKIILS